MRPAVLPVFALLVLLSCGGRTSATGPGAGPEPGANGGGNGSSSAGGGNNASSSASTPASGGNSASPVATECTAASPCVAGTRGCPSNVGGVPPDEGSRCSPVGTSCYGYESLSCPTVATCAANGTWEISCPAHPFGTTTGSCGCAHPMMEPTAACPADAPAIRAACSSVGQICTYGACTGCVCDSEGTWSCGGGQPGDCDSCPASFQEGGRCSRDLVTCVHWSFCGGTCTCVQGSWDCEICAGADCGGGTCSGNPACPSAPPKDGDACAGAAGSCRYPWPAGCAVENCACSGGAWSCTYDESGCEDAGGR